MSNQITSSERANQKAQFENHQGYAGKPPSFPKLVAEVGGKPFKVKNFYEGTGTIVTRALVLGSVTEL